MPEYPEVYTVIKKIKSIFLNFRIKNINIKLPKIFPFYNNELTNLVINDITQIGKYIIFHLTPYVLIVHLRMEGKFYSSFDNIDETNKHIHIIIETDKGKLFYHDTRQFGKFYLRNEASYLHEKPLVNVGPTPYKIDVTIFYKSLQKRQIPIKQLLLDQGLMAGLGNIYANEVLFASKINPFRKASTISLEEATLIVKNSKIILDKSIQMGGTTIHSFSSMGEAGKFQTELLVHGHSGKPCPYCKQPIKKDFINGRGTYYCERCQK